MNDFLIPDWVKRIETEQATQKKANDAHANWALATEKLIQADGPEFWREVREKLAINAEALQRIGYKGDVRQLPSFSEKESAVRVEVSIPRDFSRSTHADLFFQSDSLRCLTLNGGVENYELGMNERNRIAATSTVRGPFLPLNASELAERIVKSLKEQI